MRLSPGRRRGCQTGGEQEFHGQVGERVGKELRPRVDAALEVGISHPRRGAQRSAARVRLGDGCQQQAHIRVARGRSVQALAEEQARGIQDAGDVLMSLKNSREEVTGCRWMSLNYSRETVDGWWLVSSITAGNILGNS